MQYLCKQAKETINEYVTEHLPEQYQVCLTALNTIIKRAFDILETSSGKRKAAGQRTKSSENDYVSTFSICGFDMCKLQDSGSINENISAAVTFLYMLL